MTTTFDLPEKALFRPDEAADFLGYSVKTIYLWCDIGKMKHVTVANHGIRIPREALISILNPSS